MPALKAIHKINPKNEILKKVGDISWLRLRANQILCAVYVRSGMASYGSLQLQLPDKTKDEDRYQGKVGLILAMGPTAFVSDEQATFIETDKAKIGDWVVYRASDGWQLTLTGDGKDSQLCRVFVESDIRAIIPNPDMVW